ncbi:HPF/RaiA family ribosome-associated protein [Patescibacteria group bacterium]|nr:HPF/RaiA family ribosome-associated protein [Patescibacteria group bacterium]
MRIQITTVGDDVPVDSKDYATEKVGKLEKLIIPKHQEGALADIKLTRTPSNTADTRNTCHITISNLGEKDIVNMEFSAPEMHAAIDGCVNKLREPLRRQEERYRDHIRKDLTKAKDEASIEPDLRAPEGDESA